MEIIRLASEIDFEGWRAAARRLRAAGVPPEAVIWTVDGAAPPPVCPSETATRPKSGFTVSRDFLAFAAVVVLHRSNERFSLLYRLIWRMAREPGVMGLGADPDVARTRGFAQAVGRAERKMKAVLDFHLVSGPGQPEIHAAWFEPAHRVTERTAPFFLQRLGGAPFSILTPDVCLHWDGDRMRASPGADPADAPTEPSLERYWRARYATIFDSARPEPSGRQVDAAGGGGSRNPPAVGLIAVARQSADSRTPAMVAQPRNEPTQRSLRAAQRANRDASYDGLLPGTSDEIAAGVQICRRCDLWRCATQGVTGEGPAKARLMLVGEQPGDQEDLAGRPFVGPAGQMLDKALAVAGAPRDRIYVTNAVKHFKYELRGKRRLHKTPDAGEVLACRWWLDAERRLIRPRVIVALGATAALGIFGRPMPIAKNRGRAQQLPDQAQGLVTYHPSYLLRVPDADAKAKAFEQFVEDLKLAWSLEQNPI
jgi:DNA polymerase